MFCPVFFVIASNSQIAARRLSESCTSEVWNCQIIGHIVAYWIYNTERLSAFTASISSATEWLWYLCHDLPCSCCFWLLHSSIWNGMFFVGRQFKSTRDCWKEQVNCVGCWNSVQICLIVGLYTRKYWILCVLNEPESLLDLTLHGFEFECPSSKMIKQKKWL